MHRFYSGAPPTVSLPVYKQAPHDYSFLWNPAEITWSSTAGGGNGEKFFYGAKDALAAGTLDYTQCMPANVEVRINLWNLLGSNVAPTGMQDTHVVQVVIDKFEYEPSGVRAVPESGICTKDCQCGESSRCIQNQCISQTATIAAATTDEEATLPAWRQNRWIALGCLIAFVLLTPLILYYYYRRRRQPAKTEEDLDSLGKEVFTDEEAAELETLSSGENDPYRIATEGADPLRVTNADGSVELFPLPLAEDLSLY